MRARGGLGPYTIERILGRGGMGVVYLARRVGREDSGLVALKRLHATGAGAGIEKRFLQERRILGWLQHPGIAKMIDAGRTDSGEPYLVMEYVAGASLDEFCRGRSLAEIVRLFIGICETLSFAHRNLVIHRDLKPSNIVVNGEAEAKLLDFGIAKILSDSSLTVTLERALTPEFASPEQLRGEPQTVAPDIPSLGAVLKKVTSRPDPVRGAIEGP
ncbi:MAG: serine/threonine-protein kinase [Bryobacterales bacterium]|nr:serine/threonine-protein kinase [Bryobacterales bacterium]